MSILIDTSLFHNTPFPGAGYVREKNGPEIVHNFVAQLTLGEWLAVRSVYGEYRAADIRDLLVYCRNLVKASERDGVPIAPCGHTVAAVCRAAATVRDACKEESPR